MSDWQAGDLALCVRFSPNHPPSVAPGSMHTVEEVWWAIDADNLAEEDIALTFVGVPLMDGCAYWSGNFTKITPGHTIEGSEVDQREPWKVGV